MPKCTLNDGGAAAQTCVVTHSTPGVTENVVTLIEDDDGSIRISFRSQGKYTVNDIAKEFGGGGHMYAAGAKAHLISISDLENKIISLIEKKVEIN